MKRIGIDAHVLTGKYQGSRTYLENILREIGRQDTANTYLIYSHSPEETRALLPYDNFEHVRIGIRSGIGRLLFYWPWAGLRHRLDLLFTQYIGPPFYRGKQFLIIHDLLFESHPQFFPWLMRFRLKLFCRYSAARAQAIFTVSDYSRDEIIRRYGVSDNRVMVTPNGAPTMMPEAGDVKAEIAALQPFLLYVGRLEPRKNVQLLLRAFRKIHNAQFKLVVVGREDFGAREIADAVAAEAGVVHLRDVDSTDLAHLYRLASGLVFPSLGEGFGIPVLEALSYGTPVIASDRTAIPEAGGALAGYFNPTADNAEEELAAQMENLLNHPYRLDENRVRAHSAKFNWKASARTIVDAVNRL